MTPRPVSTSAGSQAPPRALDRLVARNNTFIGGIDFVGSPIGGSGIIRNPDNALYGGQTDLTLGEAFVTAFDGVRVPLGVPNLDLYGTVGAW